MCFYERKARVKGPSSNRVIRRCQGSARNILLMTAPGNTYYSRLNFSHRDPACSTTAEGRAAKGVPNVRGRIEQRLSLSRRERSIADESR